MSIKELPTLKYLREQMTAVEPIFSIYKVAKRIGLGSKELTKLQETYDEMQLQMKDLTKYPQKFNKFFSDEGWVAHDSSDFNMLKQAVDEYEKNGRESAIKILLEHYGPEQVEKRLILLNHIEELRIRRKFIDYALIEHREGRFYSAVPLLLMIIDGAINDATGKGFHANEICLDAWDTMTVADGAIYKLKRIFQKGRKKTYTEIIDMPYRHGILHGMDLGYDNPMVTAKCWCFLFVIRDWLVSKKTEAERKKKFQKETKVPSVSEVVNQISQMNRQKQALDDWKPRSISQHYLDSINKLDLVEEGSPEGIVLEYLALWKKQNYGDMAKLFWVKVAGNPKNYARDVRMKFELCKPVNHKIVKIFDQAAVICEIDVEIENGDNESKVGLWNFRLIRENEKSEPVPSNMEGGRWQIVWAQEVS